MLKLLNKKLRLRKGNSEKVEQLVPPDGKTAQSWSAPYGAGPSMDTLTDEYEQWAQKQA